MNQIVRSTIIVTFLTTMGIGFNVLSNVVIAAQFGAGREMDVFVAGTTLPLFLIVILSGSLNLAFIPVFVEYKANETHELWQIVSSFINLNFFLSGAICVMGILLANPIIKILVPGFGEDKVGLAAKVLQGMFPVVVFSTINELLTSVYYCYQRFVWPSVVKITGPLVVIIYIVTFPHLIEAMSVAVIMSFATVIQTVFFVFGLSRIQNFNYSFIFKFNHPGVVKIIKLMTPLLLGMVLAKSYTLFDRFVLSLLPEGDLSIVNYSNMIVFGLPQVLVMGISTVIFPKFSQYFVANNMKSFHELLQNVLKFLILGTLAITVFLSVYAQGIIRIIFERGSFTPETTIRVSEVLALQITVILPMILGTILGQCLYSAHRTAIAALWGSLETIIYIVICYPMAIFWGVYGFIWATIIGWYVSLLITFFVVARVIQWDMRPTLRYLLKIVLLSCVAFAILRGMKAQNVPVFLSSGIFVVVFYTGINLIFRREPKIDWFLLNSLVKSLWAK